jgi:alpha-tubulin suppressor-like RCC1 family protein
MSDMKSRITLRLGILFFLALAGCSPIREVPGDSKPSPADTLSQSTTSTPHPSSTATETITPTFTPTPTPRPVVTSLSAGMLDTCALFDDGTLKCWGKFFGIFNGIVAPDMTMLDIQYQAVTIGELHACGLTASGGVMCWGNNVYGQLGNGMVDKSPIQPGMSGVQEVIGLSSGVTAISASAFATCALMESGAVKCWGILHAAGNKNIIGPSPTEMEGLPGDVTALASGYNHVCALRKSGGVTCWGWNKSGQLGNGSNAEFEPPVDVSGIGDAIALAAGYSHTCAVTGDGVMCWGNDTLGQLGDGQKINRNKPVRVSGLQANIRSLTAGEAHTCAIRAEGSAVCWGSNEFGQLGNGESRNSGAPVGVIGLTGGIVLLEAGYRHTCAVMETKEIYCWGDNRENQLGMGYYRSTPGDVVGLTAGVAAVAAGESHTCALLTTGGVSCWGSNKSGELGDDAWKGSDKPKTIGGLAGGPAFLSAGEDFTCALTTGGGVKCWGNRFWRDDALDYDLYIPYAIKGLTGGVAAVSAGEEFACALMESGAVQCWGSNDVGQLGDGTTEDRYPPVEVAGLTGGVAAVSAGARHACALMKDGGVKCWGENTAVLGEGSKFNSTPLDVLGLPGGASMIAAGGNGTCAVTAGGVMCWRTTHDVTLGDNRLGVPMKVPGLEGGVKTITAGSSHYCVLTDPGGVKCWGSNNSGQLGVPQDYNRLGYDVETPMDVEGMTAGVIAIDAGDHHTCAVTVGGGVKCWGTNSEGELGDGFMLGIVGGFSAIPVAVDDRYDTA